MHTRMWHAYVSKTHVFDHHRLALYTYELSEQSAGKHQVTDILSDNNT